MLFLLRTAFWLTLVLVLIPLGSDDESTNDRAADVDPVSAFLAAQATMSDIGGFCSRNPQACETGGNALSVIGSRAQDGARIVYEFLDTKIADRSANETLTTGSTTPVRPLASGRGSNGQGTFNQIQDPGSQVETAGGPVPRPKPRSGQDT